MSVLQPFLLSDSGLRIKCVQSIRLGKYLSHLNHSRHKLKTMWVGRSVGTGLGISGTE